MSTQDLGADSILISIIIPTRNETQDILATLDACLAIEYMPKEIIVVDDSTDETPKLITKYDERGVYLIHREQNRNGCCGARNLGMQMARGEIVVLFNADNRPKPDFLRKILKHYKSGADYVIVRSAVLNNDNLWGRFIMVNELLSDNRVDKLDPEWSEGFSCRKAAAEAVGYLPGDFPVPFCRDYMLGKSLNKAGFKKNIDLGICVEHIVPETFSSFWRNRVWRGSFSAPHCYYFRNMPLALIWVREYLKAGRTFCKYALFFPALLSAIKLIKFAPHRWWDLPGLLLVGMVQDLAILVGSIKGLYKLNKFTNGLSWGKDKNLLMSK